LQPDDDAMTVLREVAVSAAEIAATSKTESVREAAAVFQARSLLVMGDLAGAQQCLQALPANAPGRILESGAQARAYYHVADDSQRGLAGAWQEAMFASAKQHYGASFAECIAAIAPDLSQALVTLPVQHRTLGLASDAQGWLLRVWLSFAIGARDDAREAIQ